MRSLAATAMSVSLLGGVPALASASSTRVVVAADAMTVHVGARVVISGKVTPRTATPVYLQRFVAGHWVNLGHHVTTASGAYSFSIKTPGKPTTWIFRAVRAKAASRTLHIKVTTTSFRVKAAATARVPVGRPLVVTGSVTPKASGPVRLQILRGKTWKTLSSGTLTRSSTFTLKANRPAGAYRLRVVKPFTATIASGISATKTVAVIGETPPPAVPQPGAHLALGSTDSAQLALAAPRLVFSAVWGQQLPPARSITLTNTGGTSAVVTGLAVSGAGASSFGLADGQPSTVTVPAGSSATVALQFHPTAPTSCPTASDQLVISSSNRDAVLSFASSDPAFPQGAVTLSGVVACGFGGPQEPVLHQIVQALGYSTVVDTPGHERYLTQMGPYAGTDEVPAGYFRAANPSAPVTMTPLAHYSSPQTTPYHATGWFPKGAAIPAGGSCPTTCQTEFQFPADPSSTTYGENQKLMPSTTGPRSFTTSGVFGIFSGDKTDVVFSDDRYNTSNNPHDVRVYRAYGPGHVLIPDTLLVAIDTGRGSTSGADSKNHDFQDVVMVVRNVVPAA